VITLMYSNYVPGREHVARLEQLAGHVAVVGSESEAVAHAPATRIVLGHRYLRQLLPHAPQLRWVQTTAGGYDQLPWRELAQRGIVLSRNPLNAEVIAHHAIALAWAVLRRLPAAVQFQEQGRWAPPFAMLPLPRRALVLGLGTIGARIATLLRGLGLHVRGCARSPSPDQRAACDECLDAASWRDALATTDLLMLALPLDATTRGSIGAAELAALPAHAVVVNVAREAVVDRAALLAALRAGRLGGAGIDVLDPLPAPDDELWRTPNLLVTPKVAAYHPDMQRHFESFAEEQVRRYLAGHVPDHVVQLPAPGP
jgi:phosphoglycerate dehydrogenase-like enzyme